MSGYARPPEGWERISSEGPGPFVTSETYRLPDGSEVRWESRPHRRGSPAREGAPASGERREQAVWWRPRRRKWWMAVLFAVGSLCFTVGGIASQWAPTSAGIGAVFFVGSIFFTSAAYLQYSEAVNVDHSIAARTRRDRWRPASWEPRRIDWLSAFVQLAGTIAFNVSTFAALEHGLSAHQSNVRVWTPDAVGSIAFLVSSELALAEVCHRWVCLRLRSLPWNIVALNMLGSIFFGASAIGALVAPSSGEPVSVHLANAGTSLGGACFLLASLLLMPEAAREERAAAAPPPLATSPAPA